MFVLFFNLTLQTLCHAQFQTYRSRYLQSPTLLLILTASSGGPETIIMLDNSLEGLGELIERCYVLL